MLAFEDKTQSVPEERTARMNFRTQPRIKEAIARAAALSGVDETAFTISSAYAAALKTIAAHERTVLQPVDYAPFFDAIDNPPAPSTALKDVFVRHAESVKRRT